MEQVDTVADLRAAVQAARSAGARIGFVPTMGALHEGHLDLVRRAATLADVTVVSIFVNPLQFGPGEDLDAYPRTLERDRQLLAGLGGATPALVYTPTVAQMYPRGPGSVLTTVAVRELTTRLCGAARPGHFDGVCTVVAKLFHQVAPDVAVFGRKDFQQLQVIRRMVADLDLPVDVVGAHTVREPDGVAMSSRNAYLGPEDRIAARVLSRALAAAVRAARDGGAMVTDERLAALVTGTIASEPRARIDYVEVLDPDTLAPLDGTRGEAPGAAAAPAQRLVAVAVHVGPARLIDNVVVGDAEDEDLLLTATT